MCTRFSRGVLDIAATRFSYRGTTDSTTRSLSSDYRRTKLQLNQYFPCNYRRFYQLDHRNPVPATIPLTRQVCHQLQWSIQIQRGMAGTAQNSASYGEELRLSNRLSASRSPYVSQRVREGVQWKGCPDLLTGSRAYGQSCGMADVGT